MGGAYTTPFVRQAIPTVTKKSEGTDTRTKPRKKIEIFFRSCPLRYCPPFHGFRGSGFWIFISSLYCVQSVQQNSNEQLSFELFVIDATPLLLAQYHFLGNVSKRREGFCCNFQFCGTLIPES